VSSSDLSVRRAEPADAEVVGQLLHDFNTEYDEPTPGPGARRAPLSPIDLGEGLECYLAELYVVPARRGQAWAARSWRRRWTRPAGRARTTWTSGRARTTVAARGLSESLGFSNREGKPNGPINYYYERQL
jgi:hypothetical protein